MIKPIVRIILDQLHLHAESLIAKVASLFHLLAYTCWLQLITVTIVPSRSLLIYDEMIGK